MPTFSHEWGSNLGPHVYRLKYLPIPESCFLFVCFWRQDFFMVLEPVLEVALVDQAGLELTEICLPLCPESWD